MAKKSSSSTAEQKKSPSQSVTSQESSLFNKQGATDVMFSNDQVRTLLDNQNSKYEEDTNRWENAYKNLLELFEKQNVERNKKIQEQNIKIKDLENRIQNSTSNSFAILSIFATVFVFISFNINIFQSISSANTAVFFIFIIALACCFIISVPLLVLFSLNGHSLKNWKFILGVFIISAAFLFATWLVTFLNNFELKFKSPANLETENQVILE